MLTIAQQNNAILFIKKNTVHFFYGHEICKNFSFAPMLTYFDNKYDMCGVHRGRK